MRSKYYFRFKKKDKKTEEYRVIQRLLRERGGEGERRKKSVKLNCSYRQSLNSEIKKCSRNREIWVQSMLKHESIFWSLFCSSATKERLTGKWKHFRRFAFKNMSNSKYWSFEGPSWAVYGGRHSDTDFPEVHRSSGIPDKCWYTRDVRGISRKLKAKQPCT